MAKHTASTDNTAYMLRAADGHRAYPRYPDGREFDLCGDDDGCQAAKHVSEIRDFRGEFE